MISFNFIFWINIRFYVVSFLKNLNFIFIFYLIDESIKIEACENLN